MEKTDIREDFCGACITIPLALTGVGIGATSIKKGMYKTERKRRLIIGILITVISLIITYYILFVKKCKTCISK